MYFTGNGIAQNADALVKMRVEKGHPPCQSILPKNTQLRQWYQFTGK